MIRLGEAVVEWKDNPNDVSLRKFAKLKQIPLTILQRRVTDKNPWQFMLMPVNQR